MVGVAHRDVTVCSELLEGTENLLCEACHGCFHLHCANRSAAPPEEQDFYCDGCLAVMAGWSAAPPEQHMGTSSKRRPLIGLHAVIDATRKGGPTACANEAGSVPVPV